MSLLKFGSLLKIASTGLALEDVMVEQAPAATKEIEKKNSEFLYFRARAISAGDQGPEKGIPNPNGNGDYFPRTELEASYSTFAGRQLFLNHESDHPIKSIGKILDAYEVEDPETGEYYVECLAKIDRKLHPEMARKVETGELNTVSMGCSCEASMCSVCGTTIHTDNDEKCGHLEPSGILKEYTAEVDLPQYGIKKGSPVKAFSINSGLVFNELSIVNVPADAAAFIKTIISSNLKNKISKKASLDDTEKTHLQALLSSLDEVTKKAIQEEFCACAMPKEEQPMSDKEVKSDLPVEAKAEDTVNDVLQKLNGLEYHRLASWMEKKMVKADLPEFIKEKQEEKAEKDNKEDKDDKDDKDEKEKTAVEKAINSVKQSFLGKLFSNAVKAEIAKPTTTSRELRAEFTKAEAFGDSSWTLYRGDKKILRSFVKNAFNEADLTDEGVTAWVASKEYGDKLVSTYKEIGFIKTAKLLGIGLAKVEAASPAEKEHNKSDKAISEVDGTEVGTHLDSSKPEGEKEAAKEVVQEKKADLPPVEAPMDAPKEEVKVVDNIEEALPADAPKPEMPGEEKHESAFDKIEDKLIVSEGVEAHKDKETNEIVVTDASGSEMKRLPDGFGDDVPTVLKLLQSIIGTEPKEDAMAPAAPEASPVEEAPLVEEPASAMIPDMNKDEATASKVDSLNKKAEELAKKEAELKKIEQKINNEKFAAALNARTERCKKLVSSMVSKDLLPMDEATLTAELQKGETLLDARKTALEVAIKNKVKALLANDDSSLNSVEVTIQGLKKSASKLSTPVSLDYVAHTEDDDLNSIFNSMGK